MDMISNTPHVKNDVSRGFGYEFTVKIVVHITKSKVKIKKMSGNRLKLYAVSIGLTTDGLNPTAYYLRRCCFTRLCIDHGDGDHIDNLTYGTVQLKDMYRLVHANQNRANGFGVTNFLQ